MIRLKKEKRISLSRQEKLDPVIKFFNYALLVTGYSSAELYQKISFPDPKFIPRIQELIDESGVDITQNGIIKALKRPKNTNYLEENLDFPSDISNLSKPFVVLGDLGSIVTLISDEIKAVKEKELEEEFPSGEYVTDECAKVPGFFDDGEGDMIFY